MKNLLILLPVLLLGACGDTQQAAYLIGGSQHSLTLTRQQDFAGAEWNTELVVAHIPECQRRYFLTGRIGDTVKLDVYRAEPGVFILNQGKHWFVTETKTCLFQEFKVPPPEPGELVGGFVLTDGKLAYKSREAAAAGAVSPAPTSATRR